MNQPQEKSNDQDGASVARLHDPVEAEIVPRNPLPKSVMVSSTQLRKQMKRDEEIRQVINEYISNNMVEGKDYGSIEVKGKMSKPSLFKPGAEKFCGLFKIRPTFKKDIETVEMLGNKPGIIAYICELVDNRGQIIGEGRGTAKTDPNSGSDFDINKQVKIAEKRAQIDAVLRTGGLSDFFTQDMEDAPRNNDSAKPASNTPATDKQRALIAKKLEEIGIATEHQAAWLKDEYGVELPLTKDSASEIISGMLGNG
jgi:hypothetical protein